MRSSGAPLYIRSGVRVFVCVEFVSWSASLEFTVKSQCVFCGVWYPHVLIYATPPSTCSHLRHTTLASAKDAFVALVERTNGEIEPNFQRHRSTARV